MEEKDLCSQPKIWNKDCVDVDVSSFEVWIIYDGTTYQIPSILLIVDLFCKKSGFLYSWGWLKTIGLLQKNALIYIYFFFC